jgi:hypothetical protein
MYLSKLKVEKNESQTESKKKKKKKFVGFFNGVSGCYNDPIVSCLGCGVWN